MPVVTQFSMETLLMKSHGLVLLLVLGSLAGRADGDELAQSFKDGQFDERTLRTIGPSDQIFRDPEGLRIALEREAGKSSRTGVSFPLQVVGDCALQAAIHVVALPQPAGGYGTGAALLLEDGVSHGASLQRVKMPNGKEHFVAHKFVKDADGEYKHEARTFPTSEVEVVLRMERHGSQLAYFVSEDRGQTFRKLTQFPFTAEPLKVAQVYCQSGGEPNTVELTIQDFRVEGEAFVRPGQKAPRRNAPAQWLVVALFIAIPVVGGVLWWSRKRTAR